MKYVAITLFCTLAFIACKKAKDPPTPPAETPVTRIPENAIYLYVLTDSICVYQTDTGELGQPEIAIEPYKVSRAIRFVVDSSHGLAYFGADTFRAYNADRIDRFFSTGSATIPECVRQEVVINEDSISIQRLLIYGNNYPTSCQLKGYMFR